MVKLKSARHHWWPKCVSRCWADSDGLLNRLTPDGRASRARPDKFGAIGNAHHIKLSNNDHEPSVWDESFEQAFDRADSAFPGVIAWLAALERLPANDASSREDRFHPVHASDERLETLVECLVSLAVRSPMNREAAVSLAERFRGPLRGRERNALIGLNMRSRQRAVADQIGTRGKFVVLFSPHREFIFGDGFFHNITSPSMPPVTSRILAPLTPAISVLHAIPRAFIPEPRIMTLVVNDAEAIFLNTTVQVYSKNEVFFRSQPPELADEFRQAAHLCYADHDHPIERFVHDIPGVSQMEAIFPGLFPRPCR